MMPTKRTCERMDSRLESLRSRRNESVLQMIQTLEIATALLEDDDSTPRRPPSKKPCLTFHRSIDLNSSLFIMPDDIACHEITDESNDCNDNDTFVSALSNSYAAPISKVDTFAVCDDKPFEIGIVTPPRLATKRQRRWKETTSCNTSDFCNSDLARQIEAMVLEAESAHENRHVKKTENSAANQLCTVSSSIKEMEQASRSDKSLAVVKDLAPSTPAKKDPLQKKTSKSIRDKLITPNKSPLRLLHRMFQTQQEYNDVPAMKPCDSLVSLPSDYSISTRSSSDFHSLASTKKTRKMPPQSNATWDIIE